MKLWLIYDRKEALRNGRYINFYFEKSALRGVDTELVILEDGIDFSRLPDAAVVRVMSPELSESLERAGVRVYNNSFLSRIANDKAETLRYLSAHNIEVPETFLVTDSFAPPFYPIILKPAGGKGGRDVCMIKNFEEYSSYRARVREKCIAQRPVSDLGKDLRVYVVGNKIFAAMLRRSENDFRSNFCLGGRAEPYRLSDAEREKAEKIISLFDIGCAGIDFMFDKGKAVFSEIEDVVGARMLYIHTDLDIVGEYLDFIISDFTRI